MDKIDFSCKHDVLIEDQDGTLRPMDEPFFSSEKIAPGTWKNFTDGDFFYLLEGDDEALAIDSGYGAGNVREELQKLTQRPVRNIANTHDHFDHTANNAYFDCAFMSAETKELATIPFPSFEGIYFPRDYKIKVIDEGFVFHLGNRDVEVFKIPDHAVGSLAFLDFKERILFTGDEIGMPMGKTLNGSVERFAKQMEKLVNRRRDFDKIAGGLGVMDAKIIEQYLENALQILEGNLGEKFTGKQFPELKEQKDPIIYKRQFPRPCDLPQNRSDEESKYKRMMSFADCNIIFDERMIFDN